MLDHAADLGSLLTTARRESEALQLLKAHAALAESQPAQEAAGWYWNALATALQYVGQRDAAGPCFARAVALARAAGWTRLLALALHHWGRCLVEQGRLAEAQRCIEEALDLRVRQDDPRQASSRLALQTLAALQASASEVPGPGGAGP